jgi:hypothetical protein
MDAMVVYVSSVLLGQKNHTHHVQALLTLAFADLLYQSNVHSQDPVACIYSIVYKVYIVCAVCTVVVSRDSASRCSSVSVAAVAV